VTTAHGSHSDTDERIDEFVERFQDFGSDPTPDKFDRLFHPTGTLWDAGMATAAPYSQARAVAGGFLRNASDLRVAVRRWFVRQDCVYLLSDNVGTYRGCQVSYPAVYACRLRDGLIAEARCYYDQARLVAPVAGGIPLPPVYLPTWTPELADTPAVDECDEVNPASFVRRYDELWHLEPANIPFGLASCYNRDGKILNPGMIRPIAKPEIPGFYEMMLAAAPDLTPELHGWAGDAESLCIEWVYRAANRPGRREALELRVIDVFEFAGGGVQFGYAYYDSLTIVATFNPDLAEQIRAARERAFT
jgi:ketosteroid isomerase-like protein